MDNETKKAMLGMNSGGGEAFYKLNRVQMSGDDGSFKWTDLTSDREKGAKLTSEDMGKQLDGVILKMRWALSKWNEAEKTYLSSTEYDDKWKDKITVYPSRDKGSVEQLKAKYALSTQRILYFYLPKKQEVVRFIVKASALSSERNENGELGLFDYIQEYTDTDTYPCDYVTTCIGVFRAGKNDDGTANKRRDHYATTFKQGRALTESEQEKVQKLMIEVNEKTHRVHRDSVLPAADDMRDKALDEALKGEPQEDGINPDDVPF